MAIEQQHIHSTQTPREGAALVPLRPAVTTAQRQLVAVAYADVADYSRLIREDEPGTIATLRRVRELARAACDEHGGRVVATPGDAILMAFDNASEAVACVVALQLRMRALPAPEKARQRFRLRVAVHLGELLDDEDDLLGDTVNIAARLEKLAAPGGICLSGAVFEQVGDRLDLICLDLGERLLKNIGRPVRVYRVDLPPDALAAGEGLRLRAGMPSLVLPDKPSIAVLPFDDLSRTSGPGYFASGLTAAVVDALAQSRWLLVTPAASAARYHARDLPASEICAALGVRYLLDGSLQRSGRRIRVAARLCDGETGHVIWARRFDADAESVMSLQDEIVVQLTASLEPGLLASEAGRSAQRRPRHAGALDLVLRAYGSLWRLSRQETADGRRLLARALRLDPAMPQIHIGLALADVLSVYMGWSRQPARALHRAARHAERAVALDPGDAWAHLARGFVALQTQQLGQAIGALKRAVALNQSFALAYGALGQALAFAGRPEPAATCIRLAMRLSPHDPFMCYWNVGMAMCAFLEGQYGLGASWAERAIRERPDWPGGHRLLAVCAGLDGRYETAGAALGRLQQLQPGQSKAFLRLLLPFRKREHFRRYLRGLREAGWRGDTH